MAVQLPPFLTMPTAVITDEADPDHAEIIAFRTSIEPWRTSIIAAMTNLNPNWGGAPPLPGEPAHNAGAAARIARLTELRQVVYTMFPHYAAAYTTFANALAAGNAPQVPPPPPLAATPRPPKTPAPKKFTGRSSADACHFLQQCENYADICPFASARQEIRWILNLLEGDTRSWHDEQLKMYACIPPPAHLTDCALFDVEFKAQWTDPHEGEKALDKILKGNIVQRMSVKLYNDQFNEALTLSGESEQSLSILRSYDTGLKPAICNLAIIALKANPNMSFHDCQQLMISFDESLMQSRMPSTSAPPCPRATLNSPTTNTPSTSTTTPVKVKVVCQYTRLTNQERENLRRIGVCFCCQQARHLAGDCPCNVQIANTTTLEPPPPTPTDDATPLDF
jgi:hypothetical protein